MFPKYFKNKVTIAYLIILAGFVAWWSEINIRHLTTSKQNLYYGLFYGAIALTGAVNGFIISKAWGGLKSVLGRGLVFFSAGLGCLGMGQLIFSYYNIIAKIPDPFPSAADWFYFSIIIFYLLGAITLFRASGASLSLSSFKGKAIAALVPIVALGFSWWLLLKHLTLDFSTLHKALVTWLSYSAPLGDAIYIAIGILTFQFSYKLLGGLLKKRILFLVFALVMEYTAEYVFAYQAAKNTYYNGGIDDLIFSISVITMALALNSFRINKSLKSADTVSNQSETPTSIEGGV